MPGSPSMTTKRASAGGLVEGGDQGGELVVATDQRRPGAPLGERGSRRRRRRAGAAAPPDRLQRRVVGQDGRLQVPQLAAGLDAQLLPEGAAGVGQGPQGLGLAARPVQGQGQLHPQALPQRVGVDQLGQLADHRRVAAQGQVGGQAVLDGAEPALLQPGRRPHGELEVGEVGQRRPPPQGLGLLEHGSGLVGAAGGEQRPALLGQGLEAAGVDLLGGHVELVAGVVPRELLGPQPPAEAGHVALHGAGGRRRRFLAPDGVGEGVDGDPAAAGDQQHGQQDPRLAAADVDPPAVLVDHLERPQQPVAQHAPPRYVPRQMCVPH